MDSASAGFIREILDSIEENIRDLKERLAFADPNERDYIEGKLMAYNEMLSMIRGRKSSVKPPPSE